MKKKEYTRSYRIKTKTTKDIKYDISPPFGFVSPLGRESGKWERGQARQVREGKEWEVGLYRGAGGAGERNHGWGKPSSMPIDEAKVR